MKLYLLRHATAADIAPSDAERPLTMQGEEEARFVGVAFTKLGARPTRIFTSPLLRARQTAEIAAVAMNFAGQIEPLDELQNQASTADVLRELKGRGNFVEALLVGHIPSLSELLAALLASENSDALAFGKAGAACVELMELRPKAGRLCWFMGQKQLARLAIV